MSFAVIQMVSQDDVLANLRAARRLLEQAAAAGARLAVLPENFAAIGRRDLPVIQGTLLVIAAIYVFINLAIDFLYTLVDPRIRLEAP